MHCHTSPAGRSRDASAAAPAIVTPGAAPGVAGGVEVEALAGIARGATAGAAVMAAGVVPVDAATTPCAAGDPADAGEERVMLG